MDVSDVVKFVSAQKSVTGVQRTVLDLLIALQKQPLQFKLCAYNYKLKAYEEVTLSSLLSPVVVLPKPLPIEKRLGKTLVSLVPKPARHLEPFSSIDTWVRGPLPPPYVPPEMFAAGDTFVCLGAFWDMPSYVDIVRAKVFAYRMKFAMIVYDLIPVQHPNWFPAEHVESWRWKLDTLTDIADVVFVISGFTGQALMDHSRARGRNIPRIEQIRLGDPIFSQQSAAPGAGTSIDPRCVPGHYVLVVGSIDIRKNQTFLLPIWARLARELGDSAPGLVVAGKVGTRSEDFFATLESAPELKDKVVILRDLSDEDLAALYRGAMFTVLPTLAEGWGYPVAESLAFNKVCLASRLDSIPEVGGDCCIYFDPHDMDTAYNLIKELVIDRGKREKLEAGIASGYRPTDWSVAAQTISQALQ